MLSIPTPDHYLPLLYVLATRQQGELISFPVEGWTADRYRCSVCASLNAKRDQLALSGEIEQSQTPRKRD